MSFFILGQPVLLQPFLRVLLVAVLLVCFVTSERAMATEALQQNMPSAVPDQKAKSQPLTVSSSPVSGQQPSKRIEINIPSRNLWVYEGDKLIRYFPVGLGRSGFMTPVGHFQIIRKVLDPGWENPYQTKKPIKVLPGADNPLGTRWMGFYQKNGGEYGIHGTDNPKSVGLFSSHGCVRMRVADAEKLFDMVEVGTPVEITYETVLIREKDKHVHVVVFADRFNKGKPAMEAVQQKILKQYPTVKLDVTKLEKALATPTERAIPVGLLEDSVVEKIPQQTPVQSFVQQPLNTTAIKNKKHDLTLTGDTP
jgi:lipoprotein-anchoring transpeptidase ErfK/SrfK